MRHLARAQYRAMHVYRLRIGKHIPRDRSYRSRNRTVGIADAADAVLIDVVDIVGIRDIRVRDVDRAYIALTHPVTRHVDLTRRERKPGDARTALRNPAQATSAGAYTGRTFRGPGTQHQELCQRAQRP